jgi:hypothetical protein
MQGFLALIDKFSMICIGLNGLGLDGCSTVKYDLHGSGQALPGQEFITM